MASHTHAASFEELANIVDVDIKKAARMRDPNAKAGTRQPVSIGRSAKRIGRKGDNYAFRI